MRLVLSSLAVLAVLVAVWFALSLGLGLPRYILPAPDLVAQTWWAQRQLILENAGTTALVMLGGFGIGVTAGIACALAMAASGLARALLRPVLIASQAIPVFALAPLLVIWMGYGAAPKMTMAALIIFFPVAAAFADGLRRVPVALDEAARLMAGPGLGARLRRLVHVDVPSALPALATGLRVGAGVTAIGAVIGEWTGSSTGLGYLMLWANARTQIPLMFAALATLFALAIFFAALIDLLTRRLTPWTEQP